MCLQPECRKRGAGRQHTRSGRAPRVQDGNAAKQMPGVASGACASEYGGDHGARIGKVYTQNNFRNTGSIAMHVHLNPAAQNYFQVCPVTELLRHVNLYAVVEVTKNIVKYVNVSCVFLCVF